MIKCLLLIASALTFTDALAQQSQPRHLIENAFSKINKESFRPKDWCPYPDYHDRAAWDEMTGYRKEAFIKAGEKFLDFKWQYPYATDYLEFERSGDRAIMERKEYANVGAMVTLVMAELAEGKGRFMDQIINGCWVYTERTTWVWSAHQYRQSSGRSLPDGREVFIDLGSQFWALMFSMTLHFFQEEIDSVDPSICVAISRALDEKYFAPYMNTANNGSQSWKGEPDINTGEITRWEAWDPVNNWNAWCNSHVLISALFGIKDQDRLYDIALCSIRSLDRYLDNVTMDGACSEGPHYWAHAAANVYFFLEFLSHATGGAVNCFDDPQVRALMEFASRAHIGEDLYYNYGDCPPRLYVRSALYWQIGKTCGIDELMDLAYYLRPYEGKVEDSNRAPAGVLHQTLDYLLTYKEYEADVHEALAQGEDRKQLERKYKAKVPAMSWYRDADQVYVKSPAGLQFSAKGGHNDEGHNHNDVGTFILYSDDVPLFIDLGMPVYRRETFSSERYTIWSMRSEWHNLPLINGVAQMNGKEFRATDSRADEKRLSYSTDIHCAYPAEAACSRWERRYSIKGRTLTINDSYSLTERKAADEEHFMLRGEAEMIRPGEILVTGHSMDGTRTAKVLLRYPASLLEANIETIVLEDARLIHEWGSEVKRIVLRSRSDAPLKGQYTISCQVL